MTASEGMKINTFGYKINYILHRKQLTILNINIFHYTTLIFHEVNQLEYEIRESNKSLGPMIGGGGGCLFF